MSPPRRRIEDRVAELCAKAAAATDGDLEPALQELTQLLRTTVEHMRESATRLLIEVTPLPEPRRRSTDNELANGTSEGEMAMLRQASARRCSHDDALSQDVRIRPSENTEVD
jgi:hypothetical protein